MKEKQIKDYKNEFLINMYNQMFNDIDRHIRLTWQPITLFLSGLGLLKFINAEPIIFNSATTIIIIICGWYIAHIIDSSYWYNRNLAIIANIEKLFLDKDDLRNVHYYFGKHRPNKMIFHLKLQSFIGYSLGAIVLMIYLIKEIIPNFSILFKLEWVDAINKLLPAFTTLIVIPYLFYVKRHRMKSYEEFLQNSPGIEIDTTGISYRPGHGYEKIKKLKKN